jgi:hypothetical protein
MDGGSLAGRFAVWRRDDSVYYTDDQPGEHRLGPGSQPVVALMNAAPCFVWQDGSRLVWNRGTAVQPLVLAEGAGFPAMAAGTKNFPLMVCFEAKTNGVPTIFAGVVN